MSSNIGKDTDIWMKNHYIQFVSNPLGLFEPKVSWVGSPELSTHSSFQFQKAKNYNLQLTHNYAKQPVTWRLLFDPLHPELGPDFFFEDDEQVQNEMFQNSGKQLLNSLAKWDYKDQTSLLSIYNELVEIYKEYQVNLLESHSEKLTEQYKILIDSIEPRNVEVIVNQGAKHYEAKFAIKIPLDSPEILEWYNKTTEIDILLILSFNDVNAHRAVPEVFLPSYLEKSFDDLQSLHIPPYTEHTGITNYAQKIRQHMTNKIMTLIECTEKRKDFITAALVMYSSNVVECDIVNYRNITLLFDHQDFPFLAIFSLPINFPTKQYTLTLRSLQGKPKSRNIQQIPWSPRWSPKKMIEKAFTHVMEVEFRMFRGPAFLRSPNL